MLAITRTAALSGVEGIGVTVEVDCSRGLPAFNVIGLGDTAVKEAADRVRSAVINSGFEYPRGRITVNLSPAWVHKKGSHYDLAMAAGLMAANNIIEEKSFEDMAFIGELALTGEIKGVRGILPMIKGLAGQVKGIYLPRENYREAELAARGLGIEIRAVKDFGQLVDILKGKKEYNPVDAGKVQDAEDTVYPDFADVKGQWAAKEAIVTAVAGNHGLLMVGPPGTGKTMLAKRIPGILPEMSPEEQLAASVVYSLTGRLTEENPVVSRRPFRQVSNRITAAALIGGGTEPMPGEISLASGGILFMDEFLEMDRNTIELLRKPMEEKQVRIMRRGQAYIFPADFTLIAAANPCRCGYLGDEDHNCTCTAGEIDRYRSRLSGPLCERIDMCIEINRINYRALTGEPSENSEEMRQRVKAARMIQKERFRGLGFDVNSRMEESHFREFCRLGRREQDFMKKAYSRYNLSPRRYNKMLSLARTAADLQGEKDIQIHHLASALNYTRFFNIYEKE